MIHIDKYGIETYERGYIVGKVAILNNKKTGESKEYIARPAFLDSIQKCLGKIRFWMHLDAIEQYDGDLAGACELLAEADKKFEALIFNIEKHGGC